MSVSRSDQVLADVLGLPLSLVDKFKQGLIEVNHKASELNLDPRPLYRGYTDEMITRFQSILRDLSTKVDVAAEMLQDIVLLASEDSGPGGTTKGLRRAVDETAHYHANAQGVELSRAYKGIVDNVIVKIQDLLSELSDDPETSLAMLDAILSYAIDTPQDDGAEGQADQVSLEDANPIDISQTSAKALQPGRWAADVQWPGTMTTANRMNIGQYSEFGINRGSDNHGIPVGDYLRYNAPVTKNDIRYQKPPRKAPENDRFWSGDVSGNGHRG